MHEDISGRGAGFNPPNRFEKNALEPIAVDWIDDEDMPPRTLKTEVFRDRSRSILAENNSPDLPFRYSVNPYRGCEHGCIYCYARPSHEYLGFSAGLDFESKIVVKEDAPALLEREFRKRSWEPQMISLSGNTDPYQPIERTLGITRGVLEVFRRFKNPVGIITKNALITRDADILADLARERLVGVAISITTLDPEIARKMEPRAATPARRLEAIRRLRDAGVEVGVNVAPVVPGLTDDEIPAILNAARDAGAVTAGSILLRLPLGVHALFIDWLGRAFPDRAQKVMSRLSDARGGDVQTNKIGERMTGKGPYAEAIGRLFEVARARAGLAREREDLDTTRFVRDPGGEVQGELFG